MEYSASSQQKTSCNKFCCLISLIITICLASSTAALILSIFTIYDAKYVLARSTGCMTSTGAPGHPHWEDKLDWPGENEVLSEVSHLHALCAA